MQFVPFHVVSSGHFWHLPLKKNYPEPQDVLIERFEALSPDVVWLVLFSAGLV